MSHTLFKQKQLSKQEENLSNRNSSQNLTSSISDTSTDDKVSSNFSHTFTPSSFESSCNSSIKHYIPLICISIVVVLFLIVFSAIFAIINNKSNKILEGVSVNGIDLSGLTSDEAIQKLSEEFSKKLDTSLTLNYNEYTCEFIPSQDIDAKFDIDVAVKTAYSFGRSGNPIENNYEILATLIATKQININLLYDSQKLNNFVDSISVELPGLVEHPSYYVENSNLIIVKGHSGIELLQDETQKNIIYDKYRRVII